MHIGHLVPPRLQSLFCLALAAAVLTGGAAAVLPPRPSLLVGAAFALLGAAAGLRDLREARRRRDDADGVIESLPARRVPPALRWRADELTSARERLRLARSLRSLLRALDRPGAVSAEPIPVNWRAIRRERRAMEEVAALLADTRRSVTPRGVVLARRLVLDYLDSPLYARRHASDLHRALERLRSELPGDRA